MSWARATSSASPTNVQYYSTENRNELTASTLISPENLSGSGILTAAGSPEDYMAYTGLLYTEIYPPGVCETCGAP